MTARAGLELIARVDLHGTAWLGVAGAALGLALLVVVVRGAHRRLTVGAAIVAAVCALVVLTSVVTVLSATSARVVAVLLCLFLIGVVASWCLGVDRWRFLIGMAGALLSTLYGWVVLFPGYDSWSGDLFVLATVPLSVLLAWVPVAVGVLVARIARRDPTTPEIHPTPSPG